MDQKLAQQAHHELIDIATVAIGHDDSADYVIQPTAFPYHIDNDAPQLATLLRNQALTETARRYERNDERAREEQAQFKRLSSQATWAVFAATISAASVAFFTAGAKETVDSVQLIPLFLGIVSLVGGAWAAWALHRVSGGRILERWMQARAAAESDRLGYFNRLVRLVNEQHPDDLQLQMLCLEFFRRYQFTIQQKYYEGRGVQHRHSLKKTVSLGSIAAFILAIGSGGAAILGAFNADLLQFATIGIIGTALATVASRREELNQDERNSERYRRTADLLSHIRERHSEVQEAVAMGNSDVLQKYVAAVHEQLSLEHRQWLSETEEIDETIKSLNASLKNKEPTTTP